MHKENKTILDYIGNTPLIRLDNITKNLPGEISVKCEFLNPLSSIKDRLALALIENGEKLGLLKKGGTIIEPTSGNTGVGIAFISAAKGYKCIIVMPESMSIERVLILKGLGAQVVLTEAARGMKGAINKANEIFKTTENAYMPNQFENPVNVDIHYQTTGPEIWSDTNGKIDAFVYGVGTGGTISGVGQYLKEKNKKIKIIAVEPTASPVLSGGNPGPHKIQGIGAGFIPSILKRELIDTVITVSYEEASLFAQRLAKEEGIFAGISSGANFFAAYKLAEKPENEGKHIVTVMCDTGERYLSNLLYQEN
jgi:cysteine synthase A